MSVEPYGVETLLLGLAAGRGRVDHREHFVFAHDQILFAVELDLLSGILAEQDVIAGLHVERNPGAVVLDFAVADGDDFALLRFFLGGVRDDDSADFLFPFLDAFERGCGRVAVWRS